jgi:hypothetical protein
VQQTKRKHSSGICQAENKGRNTKAIVQYEAQSEKAIAAARTGVRLFFVSIGLPS